MSSPHNETETAHSLADLSATHRDLLWVLSRAAPSKIGPLHHALSTYQTYGIDHSRVRDTLVDLVEHGLVVEDTHDTTTYRLTERARRALSARQAWQAGTRDDNEGPQK